MEARDTSTAVERDDELDRVVARIRARGVGVELPTPAPEDIAAVVAHLRGDKPMSAAELDEHERLWRAVEDELHYSMVIQWSDDDQAYIVSFPEWEAHGLIGHTHGDTYAEAVHRGQEVLHMLIDSAREQGEALPAPHTFNTVTQVS